MVHSYFDFDVTFQTSHTTCPFVLNLRVRSHEASQLHLKIGFWCTQRKLHHSWRHHFQPLLENYSTLSDTTEISYWHCPLVSKFRSISHFISFLKGFKSMSTTGSTTHPFKGLCHNNSGKLGQISNFSLLQTHITVDKSRFRLSWLERIRSEVLSIRRIGLGAGPGGEGGTQGG